MIADIIIAFALYLIREALVQLWPPIGSTGVRAWVINAINVVIVIVAAMAIVDAVFR